MISLVQGWKDQILRYTRYHPMSTSYQITQCPLRLGNSSDESDASWSGGIPSGQSASVQVWWLLVVIRDSSRQIIPWPSKKCPTTAKSIGNTIIHSVGSR